LQIPEVIENYEKMIEGIQRQIDAVKSAMPSNGKGQVKRRKVMYTKNKELDLKSTSNSSSSSSSDDQSIESSFSYNSKEPDYESDDDSSTEKIRRDLVQIYNDQEVIEIDSSSSAESSSSSSSDVSSICNIEQAGGQQAENEDDEGDTTNVNAIGNNDTNHTTEDDSVSSDSSSEVEDIDDETVVNDMKQLYELEIKTSRLFLAAQKFLMNRNSLTSGDKRKSINKEITPRAAPFDPYSVEFEGKTFFKNKCYVLKDCGLIVGIKKFVSIGSCQCILVCKFEDTTLGQEDAKVLYRADFSPESHVQLFKCETERSLKDLREESNELSEIPRLIHEPQIHDCHSFGYFFDRSQMKKKGRRKVLTSLELFAGAGGSLQG
jgi:hypothetical protein